MIGTSKRVLIAGSAFIAAANAIVLAGAAYNRGEVESRLRLTERELRPTETRDADNSGLALRMRWRAADASSPTRYEDPGAWGSPAWLDAAKMASLGFDTSLPDVPAEQPRSFRRQHARQVFLVLEFDGPAYRQSLQGAAAEAQRLEARGKPGDLERAAHIVPMERDVNSRLFAVDAGLDAAALRARWPDRDRYAIVRGKVQPVRYGEEGPHRGLVTEILVAAVHVPLEMRRVFDGVAPEPGLRWMVVDAPSVHYEAEVAFGRRLEPWLVAAARK
jgi:hypothetical protein